MDPRLTHNEAHRLSPEDPVYKQWIFRYTFLELEKDLGDKGDITSELFFQEGQRGKASVVAKSDGVVAGLQEIEYFLVTSSPEFRPRIGTVSVAFFKKDGETVMAGDKILDISGDLLDLFAIERVVLNVIGRMSGVATLTSAFVRLASDVLITPTRKTLWGWLDKRACAVGGGGTHRLGLNDAVLIKDNHRHASKKNIAALIAVAFDRKTGRFIEVEVESGQQAVVAAEQFKAVLKTHAREVPCVIMFDNMSPKEIKTAIEMMNLEKQDGITLEASGSITEANVKEYAKTGVHIISSGALTHSAYFLDVTMNITA